ncbi:MAG: hypothetical protein KDA28_01355 [Phycisphaerales bacterium]|nr:hypothetical protein [Phycisphaerales bacterium]
MTSRHALILTFCVAAASGCAGPSVAPTDTAEAAAASPVQSRPKTRNVTELILDTVREVSVEGCPIGTPDGHGGCVVTPEDRRVAMTPLEQWAHVLTACPDPHYGSFADVWQWEPTEGEDRVQNLDWDGESTYFDLLDRPGMSIIFRVRDRETDESLAVCKMQTSGTRIHAEVFAYRISRFLGFDELVVPATIV